MLGTGHTAHQVTQAGLPSWLQHWHTGLHTPAVSLLWVHSSVSEALLKNWPPGHCAVKSQLPFRTKNSCNMNRPQFHIAYSCHMQGRHWVLWLHYDIETVSEHYSEVQHLLTRCSVCILLCIQNISIINMNVWF